ncbi:hypothetical protein PG995_012155 [Apiospora arundinis]
MSTTGKDPSWLARGWKEIVDLRKWYSSADGAQGSHDAHQIFKEAFEAFSTELSNGKGKDKTKLEWITNPSHGNLRAVLASVAEVRTRYEAGKCESKARQLLVSVSEKIHHYSGIVDVFVSHHPEYTALVWGAMKVLFVGLVNHQKVMHRLSEGLIQISDLLPRIELTAWLYPIPPLRQIITKIYGHILRFLVRALGWYQESKPRHAFHSLTRPTELRYDDILSSIASLSRSMLETAGASSQAEQRDMHLGIRQQIQNQETLQGSVERLTSIVLEMQSSMAAERVFHESARIEFRQQLSGIQLVQFMSHVKVIQLPDPVKSFQASLLLSKRRRTRPSAGGPAFWLEDKVQKWNQSSTSSLVAVSGAWKTRFHLQSFCTQAVAMLRDAQIPVIWALKTPIRERGATDAVSSIDLIKYLIAQAIAINKSIHTDAALTPCHKSFVGAQTEDDWVRILGSVLQGIPYLYIILDIEVVSQNLAGPANDFWLAAFGQIFNELSARGSKTLVRVALVGYGASPFRGSVGMSYDDCVVTVGRARQAQPLRTRLPRRGKDTPGSVCGEALDLTQLPGNSVPRTGRGKHPRRVQRNR